jgi:transcriptional regulator with XRE-family HTH domain
VNPVRQLRRTSALTQQQLAEASGTSQPTIAAYEAETKSPTWRTLNRLADAAGCEITLQIVPPLRREERRSIALHAVIAEHLRRDPDAVLARAHRSLDLMSSLHPGARYLLDEWRVLLRRPLSALLPVLTDPSPWCRELRHVTPFTGVLSALERKEVYQNFRRDEAAVLDARVAARNNGTL